MGHVHGLAIDGPDYDKFLCHRVFRSQVVAGSAVQLRPNAILADDDAQSVVLISCSHSDPVGGCCALVGRHGGMKPGGRGMGGLIEP
jgi:hypothetical protein